MANENPNGTVLTEEEKIKAAVDAKEKEWQEKYQKQVNEASKAERIKYEKELEKAKLTETERLAQEAKEEKQRLLDENNSLKQEKALNVKKSLLSESKLPSHYINDSRLLGAKDEDEAKSVIKTITKEHNDYLSSIRGGSSTSPQVGTGINMTTEQLAELAESNPAEYQRIRREQKAKRGGR